MYLTHDMLQPQTLTQDLYDLTQLEGDLLTVRAQQHLGAERLTGSSGMMPGRSNVVTPAVMLP